MNENKLAQFEKVLEILAPLYPNLKPALAYSNPFELLVATVLSAQCTDAMVNQVTPALFARFPSPKEMAEASSNELETLVHSTGFYRNKAKNIKALSKILIDQWQGKVPKTMNDLIQLPGVGRKTAGVVLSVFFDVPAIIVDTHFARVSFRLGFTESKNPDIIEKDIAGILQKKDWTKASHLLNQHGRNYCEARKPKCETCPIRIMCPNSQNDIKFGF
jgi:endonuclease-3